MPLILIHAHIGLEEFAQQIMHSIDQRFHNYQTTFPEFPTSEEEYGELQTYAAYAAHAGDNLPPGVDIERIVV